MGDGCARGLLAPHQRAAHALCRLKCFVEKIASNVHSDTTGPQAPWGHFLGYSYFGGRTINQTTCRIKHEKTKRSTGLPDVNQ